MTLQEIRNQAERLDNYKLSEKEFYRNLGSGFWAVFVIVVIKIITLYF